MPAPPPGGGGSSDNSAGMLWGIAAIFAFLGGIWFVFKNQIIYGYLSLKLFELNIVSMVTGGNYSQLSRAIQAGMVYPGRVTFEDLVIMGAGVGDYVRYPFVLLMFILAAVVYFGSSTRVFKRTYSMQTLSKLENAYRPFITPVVGLDLINQDLDKGPWAMAMSPMQFCKRYRLLEEVKPQRYQGMKRSEWDRIDVVLKRGKANRLFIMQLGPLWSGPDKLPLHARALFAAFAARINADKAGSKLLAQLAESSTGKMNYKGVDELLKKHYNSKTVQHVVQTHAYVLTVMAEMLERARDDGVQASSEFLWLKPIDRRLWYTLNTVGRQTPFIEVGGIFAHWVAEKEARTKLMVPMVEEATNAVEVALKEIVYQPDEKE